MTPKETVDSRDASQKDEEDWPKLQAMTPVKKSRGGFGAAAEAAGLSHGGFQPPVTLQAGHKRAAVSATRPTQKTLVKVARQIHSQ